MNDRIPDAEWRQLLADRARLRAEVERRGHLMARLGREQAKARKQLAAMTQTIQRHDPGAQRREIA